MFEGEVGWKFLKDGGDAKFKQGNFGELFVSELLPPLEELAARGLVFTGSVSGVTSTVGLATTYTGLLLSNNPGNNRLIVPLYIGFAQSVINAAVNAFGVLGGFNAVTAVTHTTPVTPRSTYLGNIGQPAPVGTLDSAATLPTAPTWLAFFNSTPTATTNPNGFELETKGRFIIPPGGYIGLGAIAASPASALHIAMTWAELPIP